MLHMRSSGSFRFFLSFPLFQIVLCLFQVVGCLSLSKVQVVRKIQAASIAEFVHVVLVCSILLLKSFSMLF